MAKKKKTIEDCIREITSSAVRDNVLSKAPDRDDEQYSFVSLFKRLAGDAEEAIDGNCILFSMTEQVAQALCDMEKAIPDGLRGVELDMPSFLTTGVRFMHGEENMIVTPIAKGRLNDILVDDGYYPNNVFIRINRNKVSIVVSTTGVEAVADIPGDTLVNAVREAMKASPEDFERNAETFFKGNENAPRMG